MPLYVASLPLIKFSVNESLGRLTPQLDSGGEVTTVVFMLQRKGDRHSHYAVAEDVSPASPETISRLHSGELITAASELEETLQRWGNRGVQFSAFSLSCANSLLVRDAWAAASTINLQ